MNQDINRKKYLQTQVSTASSEQLLLMLYDGAAKFLSQGIEAMEKKEILKCHENLIKTQKIVVELMCSLNFEVFPELTNNLSSLYLYMYERLVEANIEKNPEKAKEVLNLLATLRSGWQEAVKVVRGEQLPTGTSPKPPSSPQPGGGSINLQG